MKVCRGVIAAAGTLAVLLLALLGVTLRLALDDEIMAAMFRQYSQVPMENPQEHYPALAAEITDYLDGKSDGLPSFQPHEEMHMQDVRGLIALAKTVSYWCLGVILGAAAFMLFKDRGHMIAYMKISRRTALFVVLVGAALGLWGM